MNWVEFRYIWSNWNTDDRSYRQNMQLVGDTFLKSVRSHCVPESAATDVTGDKLDCHFTHTLQYPWNWPMLERLNPPLYSCNLINTVSLKYTTTAGAGYLSVFVWTALSSSTRYRYVFLPHSCFNFIVCSSTAIPHEGGGNYTHRSKETHWPRNTKAHSELPSNLPKPCGNS